VELLDRYKRRRKIKENGMNTEKYKILNLSMCC